MNCPCDCCVIFIHITVDHKQVLSVFQIFHISVIIVVLTFLSFNSPISSNSLVPSSLIFNVPNISLSHFPCSLPFNVPVLSSVDLTSYVDCGVIEFSSGFDAVSSLVIVQQVRVR